MSVLSTTHTPFCCLCKPVCGDAVPFVGQHLAALQLHSYMNEYVEQAALNGFTEIPIPEQHVAITRW